MPADQNNPEADYGPPGWLGLLGESRSLQSSLRLAWMWPLLLNRPRAKGQPVLVLPGFSGNDLPTTALRNILTAAGYEPAPLGLRIDAGALPDAIPLVAKRLQQLADRHQQPIRLVGWSLGGVLAREAARDNPEAVDRVITMGAPVVGGPAVSQLAHMLRARGISLADLAALVTERNQRPIQVPVTAIYSRQDGIVDWRACVDRQTRGVRNIEVAATHLGMMVDPAVLTLVLDALHADGPR